jgi:hypothetical protein
MLRHLVPELFELRRGKEFAFFREHLDHLTVNVHGRCGRVGKLRDDQQARLRTVFSVRSPRWPFSRPRWYTPERYVGLPPVPAARPVPL